MRSKLSLFGVFLLLTGCTQRISFISDSNENIDNSSTTMEDSSKSDEATSDGEKKSLVVYFSASGHTKKVAQTIAEHTDSSSYELQPVTPYTNADLNYSNSNSRVCQEHNDVNRHVELKTTTVEGFQDATYIYLGAPVWWQELSWVINEFVKDNDFTNKTIIPFGTSSSSSFSVDNLKKLNSTGTYLERKRFSSNVSSSEVVSWVESLSL